MRSLYWKIFISFWLATIFIILTIAWLTSEITRKSSIPAREKIFMDSYANAAVATFESGHHNALKKLLEQTGQSRKMTLFLLSSSGEILSYHEPPESVKRVAKNLENEQLDEGVVKFGDLIVSHEILSTSGKAYRLAAVSQIPISNFIAIPWAQLTIRLATAIFISGLICYLLSRYLTFPLRQLSQAAKSIAKGKLNTRVGHFRGHSHDEIDELTAEFDRMAEQLERMVHSKERLLQDISHELRSPLARLNIAIELGRNKAAALAEPEFSRMLVECERLNTLIGEILHFARLDKSTDELNTSAIPIQELVAQIVIDAHFESAHNDKHVELIVDPNTPETITADERLIHRAIENILRNAIRYSPSNAQIIIEIGLTKDNHNILIQILDEGPGVPEDQLEKIFYPFYRVDVSREKKTGGYGLGLAIAQKAIQLHQGTIIAKNRPEGGLAVHITLPIIPAH